ncbi:TPA: LuxR family transcriptional regulator [Klebsiella quasipneumoniae subsp. similipneumoniae]|uniref:LuxR family transcriptional regulator n=2 Tax=Enterobacterales TaxID=91347 RepID=A0ABY2PSH8_9ENTR|nr:LuxR family transcriptional regulator [Citrobacter murliniae]HBS2769844.1 LuxR family transcriptional regulator [Klebsiella quasipneumoniae subsp. similipneumoniae]HBS2794050.1 LuxR family transcriptional regulator [Klebsiella quasipneumoniae subsp. similipneumoniae]HBX2729990.1 LuxR family transcriptional regulator [Klebsiella pneumoniae]HCA4371213.1 LuxR family transcriptional regulator [Klebsiella quasipneumoniae subsp. similipneumoniae]
MRPIQCQALPLAKTYSLAKMVDMKITIWEGCDLTVAAAIKLFVERSSPYSIFSRRYPILRLIQEVIDPAVAAYVNSLPPSHKDYISGVNLGFSEVLKKLGLNVVVQAQRLLLRNFVMTLGQQTSLDKCFTATIESLIELVSECASKRPKKSSPAKGVTINSQRKLGYCEFCGNQTEFSKLISEISEFVANDNEFPVHEKQVLSHRYCSDHRPKLTNGLWNPKYRQGKRSLEQFNKELIRLRRQCAKPHKANANTGDILIDTYFHEWMQGQTLTPADLDKLRNIARRMVDSKFTDTKKKIIILKHHGFNQFETAQVLEKNHYTTMTKQAVSKALASVRKEFYI